MIHETVDLRRWVRHAPLEEMRVWASEQWERFPNRYAHCASVDDVLAYALQLHFPVTSPVQLAVVEQLRWAHSLLPRGPLPEQPPLFELPALPGAGGQPNPPSRPALTGNRPAPRFAPPDAVPADVFLFGVGEGHRREVTKLGGLPYWPARRPWPHTPDGTPMAFIFQFCFADSRDITPDLPGDVLCVFADTATKWSTESNGDTAHEWQKLGETDLIGARDIPRRGWRHLPDEPLENEAIAPMYGVLHRTFDTPRHRSIYGGLIDELAVLSITKIGAEPRWVQGYKLDPDETVPIASCTGLYPLLNVPYPYINVPNPMVQWDKRQLHWGDVGACHVFHHTETRTVSYWECS